MTLVLGIDLGTTSVKAIMTDMLDEHKVLFCTSESTKATIQHSLFDEQDVKKIFLSLERCVSKIKDCIGLSRMLDIAKIAVCGQMHGCVLWKSPHLKLCSCFSDLPDEDDISHLITWQDQRCSQEFLNGLPASQHSLLPLSTGFGCASMLWMTKEQPDLIKKYDSCGTVADYLVARLCMLARPMMSDHNAVSWGYFNPQNNDWDFHVMSKAGFPMRMLPTVVRSGTVVGKLAVDFCGISMSADVMVAMGDMQCSVMSCQIKPDEAVFNLSTSAQLSMMVHKKEYLPKDAEGSRLHSSVTRVPYFGDYDLLTAASLNGGAVFANFVRMLTDWTRQFNENITEEMVYDRLITSTDSDSSQSESLMFFPTLYGERHDPTSRATLANIGLEHLNFGVIARSLARGILQNVRSMFEKQCPVQNIQQMWVCGGAFTKNCLFKEELTNHVFNDIAVSFMRDSDAALGAALSVSR